MRRVSLEFARADGTNLTEGQLIFISVVADLARDLYNEAWGHLSDNVAVVRRAATLFDVSTDQHIVDIAKGVVTKVGWNEGMPRFTNGVEVSWNDGMPRFTNGVDASSSTTGQIRGEASPFCSAKRNLQFSPIRQPREQTPRTPRTPWQGTLGSCGSGTFQNPTEVTALEGLSPLLPLALGVVFETQKADSGDEVPSAPKAHLDTVLTKLVTPPGPTLYSHMFCDETPTPRPCT